VARSHISDISNSGSARLKLRPRTDNTLTRVLISSHFAEYLSIMLLKWKLFIWGLHLVSQQLAAHAVLLRNVTKLHVAATSLSVLLSKECPGDTGK
ncbi:hypothetical protein BaRGS_00026906, partial [Batillaria attramentaria]